MSWQNDEMMFGDDKMFFGGDDEGTSRSVEGMIRDIGQQGYVKRCQVMRRRYHLGVG
jgi:hypothetical protein